jgi:hypothetical protein
MISLMSISRRCRCTSSDYNTSTFPKFHSRLAHILKAGILIILCTEGRYYASGKIRLGSKRASGSVEADDDWTRVMTKEERKRGRRGGIA